jgi:hypothetical protein
MARKTGILRSLRSKGFDKSRVTPFTRGAHVSCSQCEALVINGVACHELGCPNIRSANDRQEEEDYS